MKSETIDFYFGLVLFFSGYFLSIAITLAVLFFFVNEIEIIVIIGILFLIMGIQVGSASLIYFLGHFTIVRR